MPGLIAASVWMIPLIVRPFLAWIDRSRLLMIPVVRVRSRPNGLPRASTFWPTTSLDESPRGIGVSPPGGSSTRITAMSLEASEPMTFASRVVPSWSVTSSESAPSTTWLLVRMCPSPSITNPEPEPRSSSRHQTNPPRWPRW